MIEPDIPTPLAALSSEAVQFEDDWRWDEALDAWERAREEAGGDDRLLGECESGRARALFALGRPDEADDADRAAAARFGAADEPALATLCEAALALRQGMAGWVEEALPRAERARDEINALHDDPEAAVAGGRAAQVVARLLFLAGQPDEGERQYLDARDRFADAGDDRRLASCDASLALDLLGADRFEDAEGRAEAAVAGLTMADRVLEAAQLQLVLGRLQAESERFEESLNNLRAAHTVFDRRELWPAAAEAMHLEALVLASTEQYEPAIELFEEAIALAERIGMSGGEGTSRLELAHVLGRLGRLDEAATQFESASIALAKSEDLVGGAHAAYGLGTIRRAAGDLDGALEAFRSAAESFAVLEAPAAEAQSLFDGGAVLAQQGRIDDALTWLERAAVGFAADGDPLQIALVRRAWGATAGFAGRPEGLDALTEARAVFEDHGAIWDVAECDGMSAQVLGRLGRYEEAVAAGEAAVVGFRSVDDALTLAAAEMMLGHLLAEAGRPEDALSHLEHAVEAAAAAGPGTEPFAVAAHDALAEALELLGQDADAAMHRAAALRLADAAEAAAAAEVADDRP